VPRTDDRNRTFYWCAPAMPGLSLLTADFTTHEYPPHRHDALVVAVTEAGGAAVQSRGIIDTTDRQRLLVFNPDEPHAGWMGASERWRYRGFYLAAPALASLARGLGLEDASYFTRNSFADPDLIDAFLALHRAYEQPGEDLRSRELLLVSFGALFRRHGHGRPPVAGRHADRAMLARALAIIEERHAERLVLDDIALPLGLSEFQLIHLFRRTIGLTPHAVLVQRRLDSACRALKRGVPIAEAATRAGFYDQAALNKHFKRCFAMTPLQFVRAQSGRAPG
jgi:AraC-like DNA-binding protein